MVGGNLANTDPNVSGCMAGHTERHLIPVSDRVETSIDHNCADLTAMTHLQFLAAFASLSGLCCSTTPAAFSA
jgi:hypothetical protein